MWPGFVFLKGIYVLDASLYNTRTKDVSVFLLFFLCLGQDGQENPRTGPSAFDHFDGHPWVLHYVIYCGEFFYL